jgi:branched-chain amino acid transport system ATP-binding protein
MSLLQVRDLTVHYGGIEAVRGIDLDVHAGELVSLIGANGAGKTSTMGALGGLLTAGGSLTYDGVDLSRLPAHERVGRGLA